MIGEVKLEYVTVLDIHASSSPHDPNAGFTVTLPIPAYPVPLNISLRDDKSFNLPILTQLPDCHPWRRYLPPDYIKNAWILAINDDEPITASGAIETFNFLRQNDRTTCIVQFHERLTYSGTLLMIIDHYLTSLNVHVQIKYSTHLLFYRQ